MTREELLRDEWVKENFGDACYPNYLEPNFEAGVEYGERKAIEKACKWLEYKAAAYMDYDWYDDITRFRTNDLINDFKKEMEGEV